jgi:hypothetical protein
MIRRLLALPALIAALALLAGCGSSGSSSSSAGAGTASTSSTAPSASSSTTPPTSSTSSTATTGSTAAPSAPSTPSAPSAADPVAACKHGVRALPHLSQRIRERLETICEKAASHDVAAKRKAAQEACREIVGASPLPPGEARERALAACKNAGGASAKK